MGKKTNLNTAQNNHIFFGKGRKMYKRISFMLAVALVLGLAGSASAASIVVSRSGPWNIPDISSMYVSMAASSAPAGAYITDVKYRLKVDDRDYEIDFWCSDYEIHLSNTTHSGPSKYKTCWDNWGVKTDQGLDDDTDDDSDIYLDWRSTSAFNGENPNQTWYVRVEDNKTNHHIPPWFVFDGLGELDYVQMRIYYNTPPVAQNDAYSTPEDTTLTVPAPGVLTNDTDPDPGDILMAHKVSNPSHGTLSWSTNGSFTYTPDLNFNGPDSFTYKARDFSVYSNVATVSITVSAVNDPPIASFTYSPANPVVGEEITFEAASSSDPDGEIVNYQWRFGDGSSGSDREGTHAHTYSEPGEYTVRLTVTDDGDLEDSEQRDVIVIVGEIDPNALTFIIYVDDDSPNDPAPYDASVSDPSENGTPEHPFDMIQEGIDAALDGETVFVRDGTYWEAIEFAGRNITVTGFDPNDPNAMLPYPVIDANYVGTAVTFYNEEEPNCILEGFVITRGAGEVAGGINCMGSSPTISQCLILGNRVIGPDGGGGAVSCVDSNAVLENCTFSGNYGGQQGAGLLIRDSNVLLLNSILWDNGREVYVASGSLPVTAYCDVQGGWWGADNIIEPPLFAEPGYWARINAPGVQAEPSDLNTIWIDGDYHLLSEYGRYWPLPEHDVYVWAFDRVTSPCIDAGNPNSDWTAELWPNGERVNMGAYGGTPQASMSSSIVAEP